MASPGKQRHLTKPVVRPTLHRYFLPVVVEALKECGSPSEIGKLGEQRQGPLMVTLACELIAVSTNLLIRSLMHGQHHDRLSRLISRHGGEKLAALRQRMDELETNQQSLELRLRHLERRIISHALGEITHAGKSAASALSKSPLGGRVVWTNDPVRKKELTAARQEYDIAVSEWRALKPATARIRRSIGQIVARVKQSQEYLSSRRRLLMAKQTSREKPDPLLTEDFAERAPGVNFQSSGTLLNEGPSNYLRNTEGEWWRAFTELVEQTVSEDLKAPACIMLCDSSLLNAAKNTNQNVDDALVAIMANPSAVTSLKWPKTNISTGRVRSLRTKRRKAEENAIEWLLSTAGTLHPCYLALFETDCHATLEQSPEYPFERAYNELCWCLSRKDSTDFPFKGIYSMSYDRDKWETHVRTRMGNPHGYWSVK